MRLLSLLALGCTSVALAQYRPMLEPGAAWQDENAWAAPGGAMGYSDYECRRYVLDGDSIVNDTSYWVLRVNGLYNHHVIGLPTTETYYWGVFVALLREDTVERRVYIRPEGYPGEGLLYDFSVGVGPYPDTWRFNADPDPTTIIDVDTVLLTDGPHRRLLTAPDVGFIEGVGHTASFMEGTLWGTIHWLGRMICHMEEDSVNYEVPAGDCPCGINMGVPTHTVDQPIIHPSPTTDISWVEGAPPNAPYRVIALDGRTLLSGNCATSGTTAIDLSHAPSGTYIVAILAEAGPYRMKVVRE